MSRRLPTVLLTCLPLMLPLDASSQSLPTPAPASVDRFLGTHCLDCHDRETRKGGLDLESLDLDVSKPQNFSTWVLIHDRVLNREMPPEKAQQPVAPNREQFLATLSTSLRLADATRIQHNGRARIRRLNRYEYENKLRHVLEAPWLMIAEELPADGIKHLFSKSGEILDVSHVQMEQFLKVAESAIRTVMGTVAYPRTRKKYYAREEPVMQGYLRYRWSQSAATRAAIPLLGTTPEPEVVRGNQPVTVGSADPERREREAFGFVSGTYTATTKYDFTRMRVPIDGRYRLRLKSYSFTAGPNGRSGGDDHGLSGGRPAWWRPSRTEAFPGKRSEPVTLYALAESGDSRWLTTYDTHPEPTVVERTVVLKEGEGLRPDAARLVRTRPGWKGNPNATAEGVPGVAFNWLEVEGPLHSSWPPPSFQALFADTPFAIDDAHSVHLETTNPDLTAHDLIQRFIPRAFPNASHPASLTETYHQLYHRGRALGESFTDAMVMTFAAVLCSPEFLYFDLRPGTLSPSQLATRLAYFLWESPPDRGLMDRVDLLDPAVITRETDRLLDHPNSQRFRRLFLDHWLDLRDVNANTPDAELYPDYYLDDLLTESSLRETRLFFDTLLDQDLPARNLVSSEFTYLNERLEKHYGLPPTEGVGPRRTALPKASHRGGLLTQASILRVTANGTTTSPVIRGAWIMERILGLSIPPPPSGVAAVEPDTRGATTIREQLDQHREESSCQACHAQFDPVGFALESFDIAGAWRERYRAVNAEREPVEGLGKNGHRFVFHYAQPIDSSGQLPGGESFSDIKALKALLAGQERRIARNLVHRLIAYATGAPVGFSDRPEVEAILDHNAPDYPIRSLLHGVVQSSLFRIK